MIHVSDWKFKDEMEYRLIDVDFWINKPGKDHSQRMRNSPGIYEKQKQNNFSNMELWISGETCTVELWSKTRLMSKSFRK